MVKEGPVLWAILRGYRSEFTGWRGFRLPNQVRGEERLKHRHWVPSVSQEYTSPT